MFLFALLLAGVSGTNDDCTAWETIPAGICSDGYQWGSSVSSSGYYCDDNDTSTIIYKSYSNSKDCGETGTDSAWEYSYTCDSSTGCNCDGSIDDCSVAEIYYFDCDTTSEWYTFDALVVDLCYDLGTTSLRYGCDGTDNVAYYTYSDDECTDDETSIDVTYCLESDSCDDGCSYYYEITCTAGAFEKTIIMSAVIALLSMIF